MINSNEKLLLVGDNPFHNISHLSQERARTRAVDLSNPRYAASLIETSVKAGANGFMFSISEQTLSIIKELDEDLLSHLHLYSIVPYAFDYVRLATQLGGIPGLVKKLGTDMVKSKNAKVIGLALKGVVTADPVTIMETYLAYEVSRFRSSVNKDVHLDSVMLHQLVTDMALALNLDWLIKSYIDFLSKRKILPGFNTGNFNYFVNKFIEWGIDLRKIVIAAPFNKVGFQMMPSKVECEKTLEKIPEPNVIAISVLASGFVLPIDAAEYISTLPNIKGVATGVSKECHANETFKLLKERLSSFSEKKNPHTNSKVN
jgi:hypothetical protein